MAGTVLAVREACAVDPVDRTEEQINDICDFVQDVKFFTRLVPEQQRALCARMTLLAMDARQTIFNLGDVGDKFYIILNGAVSVQVPGHNVPCPNGIHAENCDCPNKPLEVLQHLNRGMAFGELALQSDAPRSATLVTIEKTELLVTTRADYRKYAGSEHKTFLEQRVAFLSSCPFIEEAWKCGFITKQDMASMANWLIEDSLHGGDICVRQGDPVEHMIFVRSGQLAMVRVVDLDAYREAEKEKLCAAVAEQRRQSVRHSLSNRKDPSIEERRRARKKSKELQGIGKDRLATGFAKMMLDARMEQRKKERDEELNMLRGKEQEFREEHAEELKQAAILMGTLKEDQAEKQYGDGPSRKTEENASDEDAAKKRKKVLKIADNADIIKEDSGNAKRLWLKLRSTYHKASLVNNCIAQAKQEVEDSKDEMTMMQKTTDNFASLQAARKSVIEIERKALTENRKAIAQRVEEKSKLAAAAIQSRNSRTSAKGPISRASSTASLGLSTGNPQQNSAASLLTVGSSTGTSGPKRLLLRVGTIGPYQYFGDQQITKEDVYPVSLVSDPIAEIYLMTKHDILRRLPKKLFTLLFADRQEPVPTDAQLMAQYAQTVRWDNFRLNMRPSEGMSTGHRAACVNANLEFLGIDRPPPALAKPSLRSGVNLTPRDQEFFSQVSARFLRRFDTIKNDRGVRDAMAKAGLDPSHLDEQQREKEEDPMMFHFEQQWDKMRKDTGFGLALENVEPAIALPPDDEEAQSTAAASRKSVAPGVAAKALSPRSSSRKDSHRGSRPGTSGSISARSRFISQEAADEVSSPTKARQDGSLSARPASSGHQAGLQDRPRTGGGALRPGTAGSGSAGWHLPAIREKPSRPPSHRRQVGSRAAAHTG
eukprot:TRINITY_DN22388_c1_g3_i1.p1 TRINITY_DN22388_c1_g3~~TRINITY_DN22388_c1_g3_i1.p1  ORF type:complete len:883 (-),score=226.13 TRINITY_DN22388_c1_g3_i1:152-2800(-)